MSDKLQLVVEVRLRRPQFDNRQAKAYLTFDHQDAYKRI